jgi:uncharacterized membrane protein YkvA (DUF1232 family)
MSLERMKKWIDSFPADVEAVKRYVADKGARGETKRVAAGALNYMLLKMDLVPDWEDAAGILDDAMVLRVAAAIAQDRDLGSPAAEVEKGMARLANEVEVVSEFLGGDLFDKLKKYVLALPDQAVRSRGAGQIVDNEGVRTKLYAEIDAELERLKPAAIKDAALVERTLKQALTIKLGKPGK